MLYKISLFTRNGRLVRVVCCMVIIIVILLLLTQRTVVYGTKGIKEHYTYALSSQSSYAGEDNLSKRLDPSNSSCLYYITKARGWKQLFGNDDLGKKRKFAIASMQSARGLIPGGSSDAPITFFDACVIPKDQLDTYNVNENCEMRTTTGNIQLKKTPSVMIPEGCMFDFSGNLQTSPSDTTRGGVMTQDSFGDALLKAYDGMNVEDERVINDLKATITSQQNTIQTKDTALQEKAQTINSMSQQVSTLQSSVKVAQGELPSFIYTPSVDAWVGPVSDRYIATFRQLGVASSSDMSITFWIDIQTIYPTYRNILQITNKALWGPYQLAYDKNEDLNRKPAIFIAPNAKTLHICHDTVSSLNNAFNVENIDGKCMVGIIWSGQTVNVYINNNRVHTYVYNSDLVTADGNAFLFFASRFWYGEGYLIKHLSFYDTALSRERYLSKYAYQQGFL